MVDTSGVLAACKGSGNEVHGEFEDTVMEGSNIDKVEEAKKSEEGQSNQASDEVVKGIQILLLEENSEEYVQNNDQNSESEILAAEISTVSEEHTLRVEKTWQSSLPVSDGRIRIEELDVELDISTVVEDAIPRDFEESQEMVEKSSKIGKVVEREGIRAPNELMMGVENLKLETIPEENSWTMDQNLQTEILAAEDSTEFGEERTPQVGSSSQSVTFSDSTTQFHENGFKYNTKPVDDKTLSEAIGEEFLNIRKMEEAKMKVRAKEKFMKGLEEERTKRLDLRNHLASLDETKIKFNPRQCQNLIETYLNCEVLYMNPEDYAKFPTYRPLEEEQLRLAFLELRRIMEHGVHLVDECTEEDWIRSLALTTATSLKNLDKENLASQETEWKVVTSFSLNLQEFQWILGLVGKIIANLWSIAKEVSDDSKLEKFFQFQWFNLKLECSHSEMEAMDQESLVASLLEYVESPSVSKGSSNYQLASFILRRLQGQDQSESIDWSILPRGTVIGEGANGNVFKREWMGLEVAVKEAFGTEGDFSKLHHPHIVRVLNHGTDKSSNNIVMECMKENLFTHLGSAAKIQDTISLMLQIAKAMKHLEDCSVMHRDLKSMNVLVNPCQCIDHEDCFILKLADFGLSKHKPGEAKYTTLNLGSTFWMAPEVMKDGNTQKYTKAADVFSFAITCSEILLRDLPYPEKIRKKPAREFRKNVKAGTLRPELPVDCPPLLSEYLKRCWATNPKERPQSFSEICEFLQYLKGLQLRKGAQVNLLSILKNDEQMCATHLGLNYSIIENAARMCVTHLGLNYCLETDIRGHWNNISNDQMYEYVVMYATYLNKWEELPRSERYKQMEAANYFGDWTASFGRDYNKAVQILQSPDSNTYFCAEAAWRMGYCYELGLGVEPSLQRAMNLYKSAILIDKNFGSAHVELGRCYAMVEDYMNASKCWENAFDLRWQDRAGSPFKSIEEQISRLTNMPRGHRLEVALRLHVLTRREESLKLLNGATNCSMIGKLFLEEQLNQTLGFIHHLPVDKLTYIESGVQLYEEDHSSKPSSKEDVDKANSKENDKKKLQEEEDAIIRELFEKTNRLIIPLPSFKYVPPQRKNLYQNDYLILWLNVVASVSAFASYSGDGHAGFFLTCTRLLIFGLFVSPWGLSSLLSLLPALPSLKYLYSGLVLIILFLVMPVFDLNEFAQQKKNLKRSELHSSK